VAICLICQVAKFSSEITPVANQMQIQYCQFKGNHLLVKFDLQKLLNGGWQFRFALHCHTVRLLYIACRLSVFLLEMGIEPNRNRTEPLYSPGTGTSGRRTQNLICDW